ncbi:MAG TPA: DUF2125 domain-containing protein [Phenylobacterium sp.]|nr:DUF2125 domain-containing protein [Phenylobacterium sp.]
MPDPEPARKPRRFWLYAPFVLLLLAATGWTAGWWYLSREAVKQMDAAAERYRAAGYEIAWGKRVVGGYPFRLDVTLTDAQVRDPSGWALASPRLEAEAFVHSLGHWVFATPEGLTFVRPLGGPVEVKAKTLHASLHDLDKRPPSFSFEGVKLSFTPGPGAEPFALGAAEHVELHLRPGPDDQGAVLLKLDGGQAQLSGLLARMAGGKPVSLVWDSLLTKMSGFSGDTWSDAARAWAQNGGTIQVRQAGLTAGDALIGARAGTLGVDADGRLTGALDVTLHQAPQALNAMAAQGTIPPETAMAAAAVAAARQDSNDAAHLSLTFQAGRTTLGPVSVAPAPKVF